MTMKDEKFKPAYNALAAKIMFESALSRGDLDEANEIAQICIDAQEAAND